MNKRIIANRFGLVALIFLSLFASTSAFAAAAQGPQQVVVTNTPAQPVPMVGLIKDSDAAARKPFQWNGSIAPIAQGTDITKVTTVPPNQRLVIEQVSGQCNFSGSMVLISGAMVNWQYLPASFLTGAWSTASTSIRFYVNPGADFSIRAYNTSGFTGDCGLAVSGYFVDLP